MVNLKKGGNQTIIFFIFALIVLLFDQITKFLVSNVIHITYAKNTGAAFSLFSDMQWLFISIAILVIAVVVFYFKKIPKYAIIPVALIIGGTLGNLVDRIRLGYVIDFIDLKVWPSFNIADSAITVGALILIYLIWKKKK